MPKRQLTMDAFQEIFHKRCKVSRRTEEMMEPTVKGERGEQSANDAVVSREMGMQSDEETRSEEKKQGEKQIKDTLPSAVVETIKRDSNVEGATAESNMETTKANCRSKQIEEEKAFVVVEDDDKVVAQETLIIKDDSDEEVEEVAITIDESKREIEVAVIGKDVRTKGMEEASTTVDNSHREVEEEVITIDGSSQEIEVEVMSKDGVTKEMEEALATIDNSDNEVEEEIIATDDSSQEIKAEVMSKDGGSKEMEELATLDNSDKEVEEEVITIDDSSQEIEVEVMSKDGGTKEMKEVSTTVDNSDKEMEGFAITIDESNREIEVDAISISTKGMEEELTTTENSDKEVEKEVITISDSSQEMEAEVMNKDGHIKETEEALTTLEDSNKKMEEAAMKNDNSSREIEAESTINDDSTEELEEEEDVQLTEVQPDGQARCLHFPSLEVEEAAMHNHDSSREVETEAKSKDVGTKEVGEKVGQVETQPDDQAGTSKAASPETDCTSVTLGEDFDTLLQLPQCCGAEPQLTPSSSHTVLFVPYHPNTPYPSTYKDEWDRDHVRMPCSAQNKYPEKIGSKNEVSRWELICQAFKKPISTSYELETAIRSYNFCYKNFNLKLLHVFLHENITPEKHEEFIGFTLPGIIELALSLPRVCTQAIPFLKKQKEHTVTMSQHQASCLLACAFLCMFPRRNPAPQKSRGNGKLDFPSMNFLRLFELEENDRPSFKKMEKLRCIIHYFNRVLQTRPRGTISFKRQVLAHDEAPNWSKDCRTLCRLRVTSDGTIEDDAPGLLQVDFANSMVGGGVLGKGCVQEEIRFLISPELIVSRLITERLEDNECLIVTGPERFSNYTGYAKSFKWAGDHVDKTPRDSWGRLYTVVVAIDAKPGLSYEVQLSPPKVKRELEKAYVGFLSRKTLPENLPAVATGKWGCGAFNGNPQLKSVIQIMAATAAQRDVCYFTFHDEKHAKELYDVHLLMRDKGVSISRLWKMISDYRKSQLSYDSPKLTLFAYFSQELATTNFQT